MSLIPSESYSFPDHFTTTVTPSRKPKEEKKVDPARTKPTIVALPDPPPEPSPMLMEEESQFFSEEPPIEPVQPVIEPMRPKPAPPNPALLRATAPPPRISDAPVRKISLPPTLKPKMRWNNRAPAMDPTPGRQTGANEAAPASIPAANVIPMQPKPARPPRSVPPPSPVPAAPERRPVLAKPVMQKPQTPPVSNTQADFFEMFAESGYGLAIKHRKQMKFRRFVACESTALAVLVPLVILGLALDITAPALRWIMNILTIAAAISAAVIPIVFYAGTPTLPEIER